MTRSLIPSQAPMRARLRDRRDLNDALRFYRLSTRELSELCGSLRHMSTISHLRSGQRNTCSVHLARRIEEILRQHAGALFTPLVTSDKVAITPPTVTRKRAVA